MGINQFNVFLLIGLLVFGIFAINSVYAEVDIISDPVVINVNPDVDLDIEDTIEINGIGGDEDSVLEMEIESDMDDDADKSISADVGAELENKNENQNRVKIRRVNPREIVSGQNLEANVEAVRLKIDRITENGRVRERLRVNNVEAETELEIEEEIGEGRTKIKVKLSNGNNQEIKIMPDRASEVAIARLRSKNISIELKEVGGNETDDSDDGERKVPRVVYHIRGEREGRVLGIFKMKAKVEAEIDSETGEFLSEKTPWWGFLLFGDNLDEEDVVPESGSGDSVSPGETPIADPNENDE
jgi:hypothetical protein